MDDNKLFQQKTSRRTFLKQSATALAMATILPSALSSCSKKEQKHDCDKCTAAICSKFSGVQIGAITYSWRSMPAKTVNEIIAYCKVPNIPSQCQADFTAGFTVTPWSNYWQRGRCSFCRSSQWSESPRMFQFTRSPIAAMERSSTSRELRDFSSHTGLPS